MQKTPHACSRPQPRDRHRDNQPINKAMTVNELALFVVFLFFFCVRYFIVMSAPATSSNARMHTPLLAHLEFMNNGKVEKKKKQQQRRRQKRVVNKGERERQRKMEMEQMAGKEKNMEKKQTEKTKKIALWIRTNIKRTINSNVSLL